MSETLLEIVLRNSGVSKSQAARDLNVSKSYLIRICKGDKPLPDNLLEAVLKLPYITAQDSDTLRQELFFRRFGHESFAQIRGVLEHLSDLNGFLTHREEIINDDSAECRFLNKQEALVRHCACLALRASENAAPYLYTNFPFSFTELAEAIYAALADRDYSKPLDFRHFVAMDNREISACFGELLYALKYLTARLPTYVQKTGAPPKAIPFSYYFLTAEECVLIDDDCKSGFCITDEATLHFIKERILKEHKHYEPITYFIQDEVDMLANVRTTEMADLVYTIDGGIGPVTGFYSDEKLLYAVAQNVPMQDYLIHGYMNHYDRQFYHGLVSFMNKNALQSFVNTGYIWNCREKYVKPCDTETKIGFLQNLLQSFTDGNVVIHILDSECFDFPPNFSINVHKTYFRLNWYYHDGKDGLYLGLLRIPMTNQWKEVLDGIKSYLLQSEYIFDQSRSEQAVKDMILRCQYQEEAKSE